DEVAVVTGGPEVGKAFAALPFDHLMFTGSTRVGASILHAAADNLTPVTLELGGKSPAIVAEGYPLERAALKIMAGKLFNAGQTCIAPDYVLVPEARLEDFVAAAQDAVAKLYPTLAENPDYTAIVNERHYRRLAGLVEKARDGGARVVEINPAGESLGPGARKFPPTLVIGAGEQSAVMSEEIFGPVLPIVPYGDLGQAIDYVNARPRPLALYHFDGDRGRAERVLRETTSGGVALNDTLLQYALNDLPFGGVGPSGMGAYHGRDGFETFSHSKSVFAQSGLSGSAMLFPPFGRVAERMLKLLIRR
ncbi:MAG: aldehyde dehydrogenase family protein, partial [Alphaproteobacteria bacterium]